MGIGTASGEGRALQAAQKAISSPLLEDVSVDGAMGILVNVTGGPSLTLHEVNAAIELITDAAHEDANIIFGYVVDADRDDEVSITVIATGFEQSKGQRRGEPTSYQTLVPPVQNSTIIPSHSSRDIPTFIRKGSGQDDYRRTSHVPSGNKTVIPGPIQPPRVKVLAPIDELSQSVTQNSDRLGTEEEINIPTFMRRPTDTTQV